MHFFIEGLSLENHRSWPYGWCSHVILTQKNLKELIELKYATWFGFRPPRQIYHVSLKGFWKRVSSHHKNTIVTQTKKLFFPLDV